MGWRSETTAGREANMTARPWAARVGRKERDWMTAAAGFVLPLILVAEPAAPRPAAAPLTLARSGDLG